MALRFWHLVFFLISWCVCLSSCFKVGTKPSCCLHQIIKAASIYTRMLCSTQRQIIDIRAAIVVWAHGLCTHGLYLMLLAPPLSLFNEFLPTVLLTLPQTLQVLLCDIWCIFSVHKVVLCDRYMNLSEFLIDPSTIPEYLLGIQIINLFRLILFHILYGLL